MIHGKLGYHTVAAGLGIVASRSTNWSTSRRTKRSASWRAGGSTSRSLGVDCNSGKENGGDGELHFGVGAEKGNPWKDECRESSMSR